MKVAFLLSVRSESLWHYEQELAALNFVSMCDFFAEGSDLAMRSHTQYDVLFYDAAINSARGRILYRTYKAGSMQPRVVLLAGTDIVSTFRKIHRHGISGVLEWTTDGEKMKLAIISLLKHLAMYDMPMRKSLPSTVSYALLTERERQILRLFVNGFSYKEVGYKLDVKLDTVRSHIRNIYKKLNVRSKTEAVMKVIDTNLIDQ